jgi:hypothetical protein
MCMTFEMHVRMRVTVLQSSLGPDFGLSRASQLKQDLLVEEKRLVRKLNRFKARRDWGMGGAWLRSLRSVMKACT